MSKVFWLTGLSGSGKSTITENVLEKLEGNNIVLDGDILRTGLCKDLGFSIVDRFENNRRTAEVAKLFVERGINVFVAFISPTKAIRALAKEIIGDSFVEVHVSTPLEVCEDRDPKGLYKKVRQGEIEQFTGITSPFEVPENPDLVLDTSLPLEETVNEFLSYIRKVD